MTKKRRTKLLISLVFGFLVQSVRGVARLFGQVQPGHCVVLCYHSIPIESRAKFASQMDQLLELATPISAGHAEPLKAGKSYVAVTFDDALHSVMDQVLPEMSARNIPFTVFAPSALLGQQPNWPIDPSSPDAAERILTSEELAALPEDLVCIGSHSRTHPQMLELTDDEAREELEGSRKELEAMLDRTIDLFAFPYGAHSERRIELCRKAGYRRVFLIDPGRTRFAEDDYIINRVSITMGDGPLEFRLKLQGAYSWVRFASEIKRRIFGRRVWVDEVMTQKEA